MLFLSAASGVRNKRDWVAKVVFLIQILLISAAVTIANLRYTAESSRYQS